MATPLTKLKLYISPATNIENIARKQQGIIADIFGAETPSIKPFQITEKFHPSDVWFRADVGSPKLKEHFGEMAKLKNLGFDNFGILLSGVRDFDDLYKARMIAGEEGLNFGLHAQFGLVVEYPSLAMLPEELSKKGPSLIVLDIDSLSSRMLGRDDHTSLHPSVLKLARNIAGTFGRYNIPVGASGKMLKSHDAVEQLTQLGLDFLVVQPENAELLKKLLLHAEKKREIEHLRDKIKMHVARQKSI